MNIHSNYLLPFGNRGKAGALAVLAILFLAITSAGSAEVRKQIPKSQTTKKKTIKN